MKKVLKISGIILLLLLVAAGIAYYFFRPDFMKDDYVEEFKEFKHDLSAIQKNPNKNLYWGDTHLHTNMSPDAFSKGNRVDADLAYRFAKGEKVTASSGVEAQLERPLDFLVISDHAEGFGMGQEILNGHPALMHDTLMQRWQRMFKGGIESSIQAGDEMPRAMADGRVSEETLNRKVGISILYKNWAEYLRKAERHYQPGKFTSLIGYEWTSMPDGDNLHRVVVYRDGGVRASRILPYSSLLSKNPEDLWDYMWIYEKVIGGKLLAIPHNGNLSNGRMFPLSTFEGKPMTKKYAANRARWEPLVETTQYKGDGESHPILSPEDEFADYGIVGWDMGNMPLNKKKTDDMLEFEYSRGALKNGILMEEKLGANPYKFGMIGSTDSHTALASSDENNWFGKFTTQEKDPKRAFGRGRMFGDGQARKDWQYLSSGYAAVWAESNTREDIWDAMYRKEVYGTTGPRIQLRFFGGWDYIETDVSAADYVERGYKKGVPMGGDLTNAPEGKAPSFMIVAAKDPLGANLDRVQIIKGWVKGGETYEKVYDVAWSDERKIGEDGKLPPVGNTIDASTATWTNDIGTDELAIIWTDPNFDASQNAFYYVRVLEIPTPRWSTYDAVKNGLELGDEIPVGAQERAYSSPIWYTPTK